MSVCVARIQYLHATQCTDDDEENEDVYPSVIHVRTGQIRPHSNGTDSRPSSGENIVEHDMG